LLQQAGQCQDFRLNIVRQPRELRLELVADLDNSAHGSIMA
jgi:hypothetical protein